MDSVTPEQARVPLVLAIDVGTTSVRAILFDCLGRAVAGMDARGESGIHADASGASTADPNRLLAGVWHCVDEVLDRADPLHAEIAAVGVCTFASSIVGVDHAGRPVMPLITYADTRGAEVVGEFRNAFDEQAVHQRTGCLFHTSYWPVRLRWLARTRPELLGQVERWLTIGEFLELRLFGQTALSYSVASWTGLLDRRELAWDETLLTELPVEREALSQLKDLDTPRSGLRPAFAERWPALRDIPWFPAVGDGATANVGSGCASPERVAVTVGTTGAARFVAEDAVERVPDGLWCYRLDRRRSLLGGALSEGGNVFSWMREVLNLSPGAELDPLLAAMEPDAHGLTILPFLAGERSPGWAEGAKGVVHGLSLGTTPLDVLRAGMEAVAYRIGLIFDLVRPLLPGNVEVVASGGALLGSPTWLQIVADVLAYPVRVSLVDEASARGTALLALEALGALQEVAEASHLVSSPVTPDPSRHMQYRQAMKRQETLYRDLLSTFNLSCGT